MIQPLLLALALATRIAPWTVPSVGCWSAPRGGACAAARSGGLPAVSGRSERGGRGRVSRRGRRTRRRAPRTGRGSLSWVASRRRARGLRPRVVERAARVLECARRRHRMRRVMTVIDYSLPSTVPRMWVLDLKRRRILFRELVAHGKGTGGKWARRFSDRPGGRSSTVGVFLTGRTYRGKHGYSLRLQGLERGFNSRAMGRAIVMHGAWYVSRRMIRRHGRLGRSWGCPAVRRGVARRVIDAVKGGSLLLHYYPLRRWLRRSAYLHCRRR